MVYTRTVNGKPLNFASSGKLYRDALLMMDQQTGSLWTQVDGTVLQGKLKGAKLTALAAVHTTWGEWKQLHPDTLVLKKDARIQETLYSGYQADPNRLGIVGSRNPDARLPGKALVVALQENGKSIAVSVEMLEREPLHQTKLGKRPVVVVYNAAGGTARVFDRRVGKQTLTLAVIERGSTVVLQDLETRTLWSGLTGKALTGKLAGQQLEPVPYLVSYWFAWAAYHPDTRLER